MISPNNDAAIHFIVTSGAVQGSASRPKLNTRNADERYHRCMSETPPTGHPSAPGPAGFPPGFPPASPWGPPGPVALNRPARSPVFVMLLITLVAVGAAVAAWLRPIPHSPSAAPAAPSYSEQQVADAKANVCAAYGKVQTALAANAARSGGDDPTAQLAVAINARQVYVASSAYLFATLAGEPAAPSDLIAAARKLANLFQVLTLDGLAAEPNVQGHDAADQTLATIQELCK